MLSGNRDEVVVFVSAAQDLTISRNIMVLARAIVAAPLNAVNSMCKYSCGVKFPEVYYLAALLRR